MNVEFVAPELRKLDRVHAGALVIHLFEGDAPLRGLPALVDWRLCGSLSRLILAGRLTGRSGEAMLVPSSGRLPFERLLLLGLGPRRTLERTEVGAEIRRAFDVLGRMRTHSAAAALPGRPQEASDPSTAIDMLLQVASEPNEIDELILVEEPRAQKIMHAYLDVGHRRI